MARVSRKPVAPPKTVSDAEAAEILRDAVQGMFRDAGVSGVEFSGPFLIDNEILIRLVDGERTSVAAVGTRDLPKTAEAKFRAQVGRVAREALETVMAARRSS